MPKTTSVDDTSSVRPTRNLPDSHSILPSAREYSIGGPFNSYPDTQSHSDGTLQILIGQTHTDEPPTAKLLAPIGEINTIGATEHSFTDLKSLTDNTQASHLRRCDLHRRSNTSNLRRCTKSPWWHS